MKTKLFDIIRKLLIQFILIIYSITILINIAVVIITPFRNAKDIARGILTIPNSFTFNNFISIFASGGLIGIKNSLIYGIITSIIAIIIGGIASYAFAFIKFRFKGLLYNLIFICMFIPILLALIPLFLQFGKLHLVSTSLGVILIYIGIRLPFTIFLFRNFFMEFPMSIFDAAKIDGASDIGIFLRIVMPLSKAVIATVALFNFAAIWAEYLIALIFLQKTSSQSIMLKAINVFAASATSMMNVSPLGVGYAGLFIVTVPLIVIFFFTRKYYIEGLTLGSIK